MYKMEPEILDSDAVSTTPLKHGIVDTNMKNVLLIDGDVFQNDILYNAVNSDTLAIKYVVNSDKTELLNLLDKFTGLERIAFAFNDATMNSKQFLNNELFFTDDDLLENQTNYSSNLKFIIDLVTKFNIKNIDYLVCNGLTYDNWVKYFNILIKETGAIVGASDDKTGNIKYGGDWVMETTNEDIVNIYWGLEISNYSSNLVSSDNVTEIITPTSGFLDIALELNDSWGDGWNGNKFQLKDSSNSVVWEVTLDSGSAGTASTSVLPGDYTINMVVGSFTWEVSWTFTYNNGSSTITGGSPYSSSSSFTITVENESIIPSSIVTNTNTNITYVNTTIVSDVQYKMKNESNSDIISTGTSSDNYVVFIVNLSAAGSYQISILDNNDNVIQSGLTLSVIPNTISTSTTITNISSYDWPVTVSGGTSVSPVVVTFGEDITFNSTDQYFIIDSEYVTIDGSNNTVTIDGVTNYPGLVRNGTSSANGYSNVTIQNINMSTSNGSTLAQIKGWVCQDNFGKGATSILIQNCVTNANLTNINCGGIVGSDISKSGNGIIDNCIYYGKISGAGCGGICSNGMAASGGNCIIRNCNSNADIIYNSPNSGGIAANSMGAFGGNSTIENCYFEGTKTDGAGCIAGSSSSGLIKNSYSNCIGSLLGSANNDCNLENCYYNFNGGTINTSGTISNCYNYQASWTDASANAILTGTPTETNPIGTVWTDYGLSDNTPYKLISQTYYTNPTSLTVNTPINLVYSHQNFHVNQEYKLINITTSTELTTSLCEFSGYILFNFTSNTKGVITMNITDSNNNIIVSDLSLYISGYRVITTSTTLSNADITSLYIWPVTVSGGTSVSPVVVTFGDDITFNSTDQYFIIDSEYVTIDGSNNTLTIDGVTNYSGLVQNGTSNANGYSNVIVQNINMTTINGSTLAGSMGWIGQAYFGVNASTNSYINNCSTNATCNGNINNSYSGLICGSNSNKIICNNCSSAGNITGGGILGRNCTNCEAYKCFSTGEINVLPNWFSGGGIYGALASNCTANNCYSTGNIYFSTSNTGCGGIFGFSSSGSAINCYSRGIIGFNGGTTCGGIFGTSSSGSATNCYSSGTINAGNGIGGGSQSNCYVADGSWTDASANAILTGTPTETNPIGTVWTNFKMSANTPYKLVVYMNYVDTSTEMTELMNSTNESDNYGIIGETSSTLQLTDRLINKAKHIKSLINVGSELFTITS